MKKRFLPLTLIAMVSVLGSNAHAQSKATPNKVAAAAPVKATPPAPQVALPAPEAMVIMIRTSLVALSQANSTNNYTVLNALGSPSFRQSNPPQRLAETFAAFRTNNIDLSPVTLIEPRLTQPARIENGKLRMTGNFPSTPMQVNYDLMFEPVNGRWQMLGLSVNLSQVSAAKPTPVLPRPN